MGMVDTLNAMARGDFNTLLTSSGRNSVRSTPARHLALQRLCKCASLIARERREVTLTGVHAATAKLTKTSVGEDGYLKDVNVRQVPMIADRMKEPTAKHSIDMLLALPEEDASFYREEVNVVEVQGKSESIFKEIESHYGFVGGTQAEYVRYLSREDVKHLWAWDSMDNIRAIAGISTVPKKNGVDQRKLVMQVASNYMFCCPSSRAELGMGGGAALSRCFIEGDKMAVAACDEDSAFTMVAVPEWLSRWQAGPPLRAAAVWHLLDESVRETIGHDTTRYVAPRYLRLAMGGSHSVYILMRINLEHVGRALFSHVNRLSNCNSESEVEHASEVFEAVEMNDGEMHLHDDAWARRQALRRAVSAGASGFTVEQWCEAVRAAMRNEGRTFVVMHFFSGERRTGDVQEWVEKECHSNGWQLLMISVDLACDAAWDYTNPTTFTKIMSLVEEGLIDVVIGGPPCSTVARSRHVWCPGGPRPLRFRDCVWGRPDLRPSEQMRVQEANTLWVNYMATCEGVSARGGAHLWEHPADPGEEPYASVWATEEMQGVEFRTGAVRAVLHQCPFGGLVPKLTCLSGTLCGLASLDGIRCPGVSETHQHGKSIGRNPEGGFYTRRLQTYPVLLCKELARLILNTLHVMWLSGSGPTGALHADVAECAPRVTHWSTWSDQHRQGAVLLNEAVVRRQNVNINKDQTATYVHVDDTVFVSAQSQDRLHADSLLDVTVGALERLGFTVTQQSRSGELTKVVGYELVQSPATFRLPVNKMVLLRLALLELADSRWIQVRTLRSVVGVWIFGALLCRDLLSIPHSIFHFMTEYEDCFAEWWP